MLLALFLTTLGCSPGTTTRAPSQTEAAPDAAPLAEELACKAALDKYHNVLGAAPAYPFAPCAGPAPQAINPWIYPYAGSGLLQTDGPMYPHSKPAQ